MSREIYRCDIQRDLIGMKYIHHILENHLLKQPRKHVMKNYSGNPTEQFAAFRNITTRSIQNKRNSR